MTAPSASHPRRPLDFWSPGAPDAMPSPSRAPQNSIRKKIREKSHAGLALRESSNRFEPLRASGCLIVDVVGNQRHHLESKTSHRGMVNEPNSDLMQNRKGMTWMKHPQETGKRYSGS